MNSNGELREDGTRVWLVDGLRHRLDGPVIILCDGRQMWYVHGKYITKEIQGWIIENSIGLWGDWTDTDKLMFRMKL